MWAHAKTQHWPQFLWEHLHLKKMRPFEISRDRLSCFYFSTVPICLNYLAEYIYAGVVLSCTHDQHARLGLSTNTFCFLHSRPPSPKLAHIHTHFLLVMPVVRLNPGLVGELVKRLGTSCKVQSTRKDSHWAWRCSLGFTGLLSNYSIPSILRFLPTTSRDASLPVRHTLLII